jgi:hypothetical protein
MLVQAASVRCIPIARNGAHINPGEYQSDHLIELLRDPAGSPADAGNAVPVDGHHGDIGTSDDDPLSAAKGIMNGVLISLVFWIVVGAAMWFCWRG